MSDYNYILHVWTVMQSSWKKPVCSNSSIKDWNKDIFKYNWWEYEEFVMKRKWYQS